MKKSAKNYWVKNLTGSDLIFSKLGIKVLANTEVNLFSLNPSLSDLEIKESAERGALAECFLFKKLLKISGPTQKIVYTNTIKESIGTIPSRVKTSVIINPQDYDHIEELSGNFSEKDAEKFVDYADGFAEPDVGEEVQVEATETIEIIKETGTDKYQKVVQILPRR